MKPTLDCPETNELLFFNLQCVQKRIGHTTVVTSMGKKNVVTISLPWKTTDPKKYN